MGIVVKKNSAENTIELISIDLNVSYELLLS